MVGGMAVGMGVWDVCSDESMECVWGWVYLMAVETCVTPHHTHTHTQIILLQTSVIYVLLFLNLTYQCSMILMAGLPVAHSPDG